MKPHPDVPGYDKLTEDVTADENARLEFLAACLSKLGLSLPPKDAWNDIHRPTNMLSVYCEKGHLEPFLNRLSERSHAVDATAGLSFWLEDKFGLDAFHIEATPDGSWSTNYEPRDYGKPLYRVNVVSNAASSMADEPPFDYARYFASMEEFRMIESSGKFETWKRALGVKKSYKLTWGSHLMYGETVTSTNTLLAR